MNIQDILRGLPFPMQGALMSVFGATQGEDPQQAAAASATPQAGAGRGFVNPAVVRPSSARPAGVSVPSDDGTTPGILAQINQMQAPSAASLAPDNRDIGGGQSFVNAPMQAAMQAPSGNPTEMGPQQGPQSVPALKGYEQGILSKIADGLDKQIGFSQPDFLGRLGTALAVAGSQDPTKALMEVRQQRIEDAKNKEAVRRANQPKFTPIQNGAFVMVEAPGMAPQILPIEAVQKYSRELADAKSASDLQRQIAVARESVQGKTEFETFKGLNEAAGGSGASATYKPEVKTQIGYAQAAIDFLRNGGDNINLGVGSLNSPVARDLFDRTLGKLFGTDAAAARRQVDFLLGTEVLSDVGQMKGALSDADREYLKSIRPKSDDPTDLKINYLTELMSRLDRREQSRIEAAMKRDQMLGNRNPSATSPATATAPTAAPAPAPAAPAAGSVARPASKADFDALPKGARFIAPDGKEYIK